MFTISTDKNNEIKLTGRFDASQVEKANGVFLKAETSCVVNFKELEYISSAGLGVLLQTRKLLKDKGHEMKLINLNSHILDIFKWTGFDQLFEME